MSSIRIIAATTAEMIDAQQLVFEYLSSTQREAGRAVPGSISELPGVLRAECSDLAQAYQPPGALLLAYRQEEPVGCVGLKPTATPGTAEVKRLYVRPARRRGGVARLLMQYAHHHAACHGFTHLVLDVMATRTHAIEFYRRLGYTGAAPHAVDSMVYLERVLAQGGGRAG